MSDNQKTIRRRSLVKGAAWAAPVVLATASVPAYAASRCGDPVVRFSGGVVVNWGAFADSATDTRTTDMQLTIGAQIYVDNLPEGVTVTKVTEQWFIQNHQGQTAQGDGMFYLGNGSSSYNKSGDCTAAGCSVTWVQQSAITTYRKDPNTGAITPSSFNDSTAAKAGWSSTVTNTQNNKDTVYSDGNTYKAWDVTLTFNGPGSYTKTATGCTNFTTGPSGRFGVNYYGIPREVYNAVSVATYSLVTVYLSNGSTLTYRSSTQRTRSIDGK